jgi:hypothetical protein
MVSSVETIFFLNASTDPLRIIEQLVVITKKFPKDWTRWTKEWVGYLSLSLALSLLCSMRKRASLRLVRMLNRFELTSTTPPMLSRGNTFQLWWTMRYLSFTVFYWVQLCSCSKSIVHHMPFDAKVETDDGFTGITTS